MTTPRIEPLADPLPSAVAERMARLLPAGMAAPQLFLTVARNAGLFNWMVDSGLLGPSGLADRKSLAPALRELLILRTCVAARNDYEFNLHVQTISRRMGLSEAQIDDLRRRSPSDTLWSAAEQTAMRLVDALVGRLAVDDALYAEARVHFDEAMLIEMGHLVGLYTGVAMMVALARPSFDRYRPGPPLTTTP
jgi:4-carboxymuconolactone decarboxylase